MTRDQQLEAIKNACGAALGYEDPTFIQDETYSLAHVLLAIETKHKKDRLSNAAWRMFKVDAIELLTTWNLRDDNLESQSGVCLQFVAGLVAKTTEI